jgi:hypothetical protein
MIPTMAEVMAEVQAIMVTPRVSVADPLAARGWFIGLEWLALDRWGLLKVMDIIGIGVALAVFVSFAITLGNK